MTRLTKAPSIDVSHRRAIDLLAQVGPAESEPQFFPIVRVALALAAAIAVLGVAGIANEIDPGPPLGRFDLDAEGTVPAVFSSLLLLTIAGIAVLTRGLDSPRAVRWAFALVAAYAGVDEAIHIHERLEQHLATDWQLLYLPVFILGGVLYALVLADLWSDGVSRALFAGGGAAWLVSQVLEHVEWNGDIQVSGYTEMMVAEELLEMTGSTLLLLALLRTVRQKRRVARAPTQC